MSFSLSPRVGRRKGCNIASPSACASTWPMGGYRLAKKRSSTSERLLTVQRRLAFVPVFLILFAGTCLEANGDSELFRAQRFAIEGFNDVDNDINWGSYKIDSNYRLK